MAVFIIKVNEENGNSTEAEDCKLGLSTSQLFVNSFASVKLSWNFHNPTANLLDWIGMFEIGKDVFIYYNSNMQELEYTKIPTFIKNEIFPGWPLDAFLKHEALCY